MGQKDGSLLVLAVGAMLLVACTQTPPPPPPSKPGEPEAAALAARVAALEKEAQFLRQQSTKNVLDIQKLQYRYSEAEIDPSDPTFQRIDTEVGSLAVSVADVSQFADGVKLKIKLGNLSAATISGVTLHVMYGPRKVGEADPAWQTWYAKLKNKNVDLTTPLLSGHWNPISIVLPGIEQKDFGYISVTMDATTISLVR